MEYLRLIIICSLFLYSCETPFNNEKIELKIGANAGEDQTTYVGSYVVLDISESVINEPIKIIDWIQDESNPQQVYLFSQSSLNNRWILGFEKEGTYRFTLKINCKSGNVFTDNVIVIVKPRQNSIIDDVRLEVRIRQRLNYKEGDLTAEKLQGLDSLSNYNFALKNKITSIKGIENCINITYLGLPNENISDLKPLAELIKLEYLDLNQNYTIEDISPISNLINLKTLILYNNPIKDIRALRNLTKLTYLNILGTPISDISSLSNLVKLETLYIDGAGIEEKFNNIESLANLTQLKILDIADRGIKDIKPLENLTELVLLNISYNNLREISSVSRMKKLIRLYIRKNNIEDITGIKNLENLEFLDAADNQIKDISELQYLPKIKLIGLSGNKIEDISPLVNNPYLGKGVYLYLGGNPLNEKSINEYVPALIKRGVTVYTNL